MVFVSDYESKSRYNIITKQEKVYFLLRILLLSFTATMGRKAIFDVKGLKKGQKMRFPKDKEQYIYQYLNNFNRQAEKDGRPHRYEKTKDLNDTFYIRRYA